MSQTRLKILWFFMGILLTITGMVLLFNSNITILSLALFLGIMMMISGIVDMIIFIKWHRYLRGAGFVLADSIITIILSLTIIFNHLIAINLVPIMFAMWIIFSGIHKIVGSVEIKKYEIKQWTFLLLSEF